MWLRIVDIDLDAACVHLEVAPDESDDCFSRLDAFVNKCASDGINDVRLYFRRGTSKRNLLLLKDFASMKRLRAPATFRDDPAAAGKNGRSVGRFQSEPAYGKARVTPALAPVKYRIAVDALDTAVDRLHATTSLICAAENLDARSTLQLRLCVYELATNTVEHGTFTAGNSAICLGLKFTGKGVHVDYRDNADAFLTSEPVNIDLIQEKINTSSKRGLGLYMLNKICTAFEHERSNEWNITTFRLEFNTEQETVTKR